MSAPPPPSLTILTWHSRFRFSSLISPQHLSTPTFLSRRGSFATLTVNNDSNVMTNNGFIKPIMFSFSLLVLSILLFVHSWPNVGGQSSSIRHDQRTRVHCDWSWVTLSVSLGPGPLSRYEWKRSTEAPLSSVLSGSAHLTPQRAPQTEPKFRWVTIFYFPFFFFFPLAENTSCFIANYLTGRQCQGMVGLVSWPFQKCITHKWDGSGNHPIYVFCIFRKVRRAALCTFWSLD